MCKTALRGDNGLCLQSVNRTSCTALHDNTVFVGAISGGLSVFVIHQLFPPLYYDFNTIPHFCVTWWPESKRPWLRTFVESTGGVFVRECFLAVSTCEGLRTSSICAPMCVYVCVHMCTSSHECVSCVFVSQPRPAEVTLKAMGTDITAGGRGVSGQTAGFPITLGLVLRPLPLNSSLEARRGQQRSNTLLPPPLSFHHLPGPLSADNNFLLFLTLCASFRSPHPSSLSSCVTLPLWFSHLFAPHLFPSLLSFLSRLFVSFFFLLFS